MRNKPVDGKKKRQRCNSLLTARQVVHRPETFARRDTVVVDTVQVRLFSVLRSKECLGALVL